MSTHLYYLEVYPHDDIVTSIVSFSSDTPFLAIHIGDMRDPRKWINAQDHPNFFLVTGIMHSIENTDRGPCHTIRVYVRSTIGAPETYLTMGKP